MIRHPGPILLLVIAAAPLVGRADEAQPRQYEEIVAAFERAQDEARRARQEAPTEDARRAIRWPQPHEFAPRMLALAEADPADATARQAALWILGHHVDFGFGAKYGPIMARAGDLVLAHHRDDEAVGPVVLEIARGQSPTRDSFVRGIFERTANPINRGRACLGLAQHLKAKADLVGQIRTPGYRPEDPDRMDGFYGAAYFAGLGAVDPDPLLAEAEQLYERVLAEYAAIDYLPPGRPGPTRTLGAVAAVDLDELRHLAVGRPAPAIAGEDVAGRPLTLAEHRGRVVVLAFWGSWCGPCMAEVPYEKGLAERMRGRPFALLGVNSDDDRGKAEAVARREGTTWRSWFDGGTTGGPIARRWNVRAWPTVFVVDHEGVIRGRNVAEHPFLDALVADLVAAAERDAVSPPPAP